MHFCGAYISLFFFKLNVMNFSLIKKTYFVLYIFQVLNLYLGLMMIEIRFCEIKDFCRGIDGLFF
jgi:hypothetical protein